MTRKFAEGTEVPVAKSKFEIEELLRKWGCKQIVWGTDYDEARVMLQFVWRHDGNDYVAKFPVQMPDDETLKKRAVHQTSYRFIPAKFERLKEGRGRTEMRQLFLWLKACLNAVDAGIIDATAVFLPFLVGSDGRTVAEALVPQLPALHGSGAATLLLGTGRAH